MNGVGVVRASVVVVSNSEDRKEALIRSLRGAGWAALPTIDQLPPDRAAAVVLDLHGELAQSTERTVRRFAVLGPTLVVGEADDLPLLEEAIGAGAADLAVSPTPEELGARIRLLVARAQRQEKGRSDPAPQWPASQWPASRWPASGRTKILVVEDDDDARQLLCEILAEAHEVSSASTAETGLERAFDQRPDLVLLDLFLPGMNGFQALELLQGDPRTASIPVLFLSAEADDRLRVRGLELGAADFVVKPYSAVELLARVERTLRAAKQGEHLRALAETDALTGLPNYRALLARLEEEVKRAERYRHPLSLVMLDLDGLKAINDELGHAAGNAAIVALGQAVAAQLRETDFAARYGGDEFVVLLPHASAAQAAELAERLRRAMRMIRFNGYSSLRGSFGVASLESPIFEAEAAPDQLLRAADAALYRAKREGRDRVCVAAQLVGARIEPEGAGAGA